MFLPNCGHHVRQNSVGDQSVILDVSKEPSNLLVVSLITGALGTAFVITWCTIGKLSIHWEALAAWSFRQVSVVLVESSYSVLQRPS